jgi:hypothetical protein
MIGAISEALALPATPNKLTIASAAAEMTETVRFRSFSEELLIT